MSSPSSPWTTFRSRRSPPGHDGMVDTHKTAQYERKADGCMELEHSFSLNPERLRVRLDVSGGGQAPLGRGGKDDEVVGMLREGFRRARAD